ncbi:MAG: hypothetical protein IPG50_31235 [Myxococcales bacterium]|nr:hypothetical protein [Myxococcales bacterium]
MPRTKTDAALEAAELEYQDDPERAELVRRTRRFKSSWIELAEALMQAQRDHSWKRWGYDSFDDYTKGELHLRPETVQKLVGSFVFLKKRAPEVLSRDGLQAHIPSYQAVDFLRRAESEDRAPAEAMGELRKKVLEDGATLPTVTKKFGDVVFPIDATERKSRDAAGLRNVATRLRELLADTRAVPRRLADEVTESLSRLLEELGAEEERAA